MGDITHTFTSPKSDGDDETLVRPSDWNATHDHDLDATDVGAEPAGTVATHAADADAHKGQKNSVVLDAGDLQLANDAASPGNDRYYGTDDGGTKGFHPLPEGGGGLDGTIKKDSGDSNSGSIGTLIAEIEAASGKKLIFINGAGMQDAAVNTAIRVIVTYTDDTTTFEETATNATSTVLVNDAAIIRGGGGASSRVTAHSDKDIKKVRAQTASVGTGQRRASLSALEVDI